MTTTPAEVLRQARDALTEIRNEAAVFGGGFAGWIDGKAAVAIAAIDAPPSAPATDIDEAQLARMTERGAVAWAGVTDDDIRALRDGSAPSGEPADAAPPNSLPSWDECAMRVANSDFIAKRVAEGGYGAEPDSKLANNLHRFIYEYDDSDPYRSAWFMHRLELALKADRATTAPAPPPPAEDPIAAAWLAGRDVQYLVIGGHDDEWTDYTAITSPNTASKRLSWRIKPGAAPLMANGLTPSETAATASVSGLTRCPNCDDTGDVNSITGEWRGICHCPAGQALRASPQAATASVAGLDEPTDAQVAMLDPWMRPAAARELLRKVLASTAAAAPDPTNPLHDDAYLRGIALGFPAGDPRRWTLCRIADRVEAAQAAANSQAILDGSTAEPVATLHDDGCFTWKRDEFRLKYDRQRAGWRMDVYAHPAPAVAATVQALTITQVSDVRDALAGTQYDLYDFAAAIGKACAAAWGVTLATPAAPKE